MTDIKKVTDYLLTLFKQDADALKTPFVDVSNLKLQKLLYYCQAYTLAMTGKVLFKKDIQAWEYGPVIREVYDKYKKYQDNDIPAGDIKECSEIGDKTAEAIIRMIKDSKGKYSAFALIGMTHAETPWQEAYAKGKNSVINPETMQSYFYDKLCKEGTEEEEDRLWTASSLPLAEEDMEALKNLAI